MICVNTEQQVISFLASQLSMNPKRITLESSLVDDLRVAGEDGYRLMMDFGQQFGVDVSGLDVQAHFGREGGNPLMLVVPGLRPKLRPLKVKDLVSAAERKKWLSGEGGH
jgi:acyl carrier protein